MTQRHLQKEEQTNKKTEEERNQNHGNLGHSSVQNIKLLYVFRFVHVDSPL